MSIGMIFGAQYYRPPFPDKSVWQRDIESMKRKGFNTIELWAVWNRVEREPGVYYFDDLDELVELAARNGLQTVINSIPEGTPYWALEAHEDSLYVTHTGEAIGWGGPPNIPTAGWPGFCWDSPKAQQLMTQFIEATARHFSGCDSILAIEVWNEPHLEPMLDYKQEMLCYCPHSRAEFTKWLKKKYRDLATLNTRWFRTYSSWEEVSPPPRFGTGIDMMDWRLFWIDSQRRWLQLRVAACRRDAPDTLVQTHTAHSGVLGNDLKGGMGNEVDLFGLTSFPKWLQGPNHQYTHLAHYKMVAEASRGKPFYQVELQGGAGKKGLLDQSGGALGELFGLEHKEVQATENWGRVPITMESSGEQFFGTHYRHLTTPQAGTEVLARFDDGEPAITVRPAEKESGKGKGWGQGRGPARVFIV